MGVLSAGELRGLGASIPAFAPVAVPITGPIAYFVAKSDADRHRARQKRINRGILQAQVIDRENFTAWGSRFETERLLNQIAAARESIDASIRQMGSRELGESLAKRLDGAIKDLDALDDQVYPDDPTVTLPPPDELRKLIERYWDVDLRVKLVQRDLSRGVSGMRGLGMSAEKLLPIFAPWTTITDVQEAKRVASAQEHQQRIENQRAQEAFADAARKRLADARASFGADFDRVTAAADALGTALAEASSLYQTGQVQPDRSSDLAQYAATRDQVLVAVAEKSANLPPDPDAIEASRSMLKTAQYLLDDAARGVRAIVENARRQIAAQEASVAASARAQADQAAAYAEQGRQSEVARQQQAVMQAARDRAELQRIRSQIEQERSSLALEKQQLGFRQAMRSTAMKGWGR